MAAPQAGTVPSASAEPAWLRKAFLPPAAVYPFWHLAAPACARDPWWVWWAVGASFLVVGAVSLRSRWAEERLLGLFHVCSSLVTAQLFLLAFLNGGAFYEVGSAGAVIATVLFIRSKRNLLLYGVFVAVLGASLLALGPHPYQIAYAGGLVTILSGWYLRLSFQEAAARAASRQRRELEERVRERTAALAETNRRLQREMDERARLEEELRLAQTMDVVGRLAGGVAHEFNNLLTTMRLNGDLLLDQLPATSPLRHEMERIQKAGREAATLTQQLLDFSRGVENHPSALDLNEVIRDTSAMLRALVGEDIALILHLEERSLPIWADRGQVDRVIVNLALNARDAMPAGGRLEVETSLVSATALQAHHLLQLAPAEDYVVMSMTDSGVGMDAETRARVFDPFFTKKEVGEGTGLGLSIVYAILRQAGGHVRVSSEPGKGSRFELIWPRTRRAAPRTGEQASDRPPPRGEERILLVEDEADLREALRRLLERQGYQVLEAPDGESAIRRMRAEGPPVDLVVSDVVMPGISGIELVERLASARRAKRALLISGHANHPSLRGRPLPDGVFLLRKPFDPEGFMDRVRALLDAPPAGERSTAFVPRGPSGGSSRSRSLRRICCTAWRVTRSRRAAPLRLPDVRAMASRTMTWRTVRWSSFMGTCPTRAVIAGSRGAASPHARSMAWARSAREKGFAR